MMVEAVEGTAGVVVAKVPWPASRWVCSPLFKLWIFIFFSLLCDCLWRVDANLAVPRPLEKWLFGGFKLLNLSCNSFLEEVEGCWFNWVGMVLGYSTIFGGVDRSFLS